MMNARIGMTELYILKWGKIELILISLLLASVTLLLCWPGRSYEFVNIDDHTFVTDKPYVLGGLSPESIEWAIGSLYSGSWHPLTWLSYVIEWNMRIACDKEKKAMSVKGSI